MALITVFKTGGSVFGKYEIQPEVFAFQVEDGFLKCSFRRPKEAADLKAFLLENGGIESDVISCDVTIRASNKWANTYISLM